MGPPGPPGGFVIGTGKKSSAHSLNQYRSCCNWCARCVAIKHKKQETRPLFVVAGGELSPLDHGCGQRHLRLACDNADSLCLRARCYLHHTPPRPHTQPCTLITPVHATTLHSHLPFANTAAPHSHLYFAYKLPIRHVPLGLASVAAKDRATLHIHSNHSINTTPWQSIQKSLGCTPLLPSPKSVRQLALVSLFNPLFTQSMLNCFVCLT